LRHSQRSGEKTGILRFALNDTEKNDTEKNYAEETDGRAILCVILERSEESRLRKLCAKKVEQQELLRIYYEQSVADTLHRCY